MAGTVLGGLALSPELSVGGVERGRSGASREGLASSRNYPLGAKEHGGQGWLRLWGVAGAPSVCRSPMVTLHRPRN